MFLTLRQNKLACLQTLCKYFHPSLKFVNKAGVVEPQIPLTCPVQCYNLTYIVTAVSYTRKSLLIWPLVIRVIN